MHACEHHRDKWEYLHEALYLSITYSDFKMGFDVLVKGLDDLELTMHISNRNQNN